MMKTNHVVMFSYASMSFLLLALVGCGGGGGGGNAANNNTAPVANAGIVQNVVAGTLVTLNGSASSDANGDPLTYSWTLTSKPTSSTATLASATSTAPTFTADLAGTYVATLVVNDGKVNSAAATVMTTATVAVADPLFVDQWNLKNTGQAGASGVPAKAGEDINVQPAWTTRKGSGVRIAIVDDGLEIGHEDLASNIAPNGTSYNYVTGSSDPTNDPADLTSGHGTKVAGIAAARDWNGLGGTGVAPRANLVGYNLLQNSTTVNIADAMTRGAASVHISSNSWGAPDYNGSVWPSSSTWRAAIDTGLATGRSGLGMVYTWAAGNGAPVDNSNYDGQANYRGVIAVGAVNDQGVKSSYSEEGANLWVSAPGGEYCSTHTITTTDRTGALGSNTAATANGTTDYTNQNYTKCMNGTSAATPTVAGVVALMLEAKPTLGWRDVRNILAQTARINAPTDPGWYGTGGTPSYRFNPKYGFGVVDAAAAVAVAATWVNLPAEKTFTPPTVTPNLAIPDNNTVGVASTITVAGSLINSIEYIDITFSAADHTYLGDLTITLTSPSGTSSTLAVTHACLDAAGAVTATCSTYYNAWRFGSAGHLGELADGGWTLTVSDRAAFDTGTFQSWGLKFYGH
jgi:proprotein convertase subtilisin/kexin type 2